MTRVRSRYGPWAVVTGASDGIGREIARGLAASKLNVLLVSRRRSLLDALADELIRAHGVQAVVLAADLSTTSGVDALLGRTTELDVGLFAACAGFGTSGPFIDAEVSDELAMIDVNCRAVVALTHAFARRFVSRGRGGIIFMSSLLAFQGVPRAANYAATKAYVQTFAEGLYRELRPLGVDVIAAAPGPVHSGFAARAAMQMSVAVSPEVVAAGTLRALGRRVTVRPGVLSKALEGSLKLLPRIGRVQVMRVVMGAMTREAK